MKLLDLASKFRAVDECFELILIVTDISIILSFDGALPYMDLPDVDQKLTEHASSKLVLDIWIEAWMAAKIPPERSLYRAWLEDRYLYDETTQSRIDKAFSDAKNKYLWLQDDYISEESEDDEKESEEDGEEEYLGMPSL
jgi:hypothetical protein